MRGIDDRLASGAALGRRYQADGRRRAASAAGDEHGTAARRVAAGALSASSTLLHPGGPSTKLPQRSPSGREVAATWLLCVFIAVLALGATQSSIRSPSLTSP